MTRDFGGIHRYNYSEYNIRVAKLANALARLGVKRGERVGTFGWNSHRHLEAYLAVPCMASVLHTINIRLFADQLAYIVNHAEDAVLLVDEDLVPALEAWQTDPHVRAFVRHGGGKSARTEAASRHSYDALLDAEKRGVRWPSDIDGTHGGPVYTTGPTAPEGRALHHRGICSTPWAICTGTGGDCEKDAVMRWCAVHVKRLGDAVRGGVDGGRNRSSGVAADARAGGTDPGRKSRSSAGVPTRFMGVAPL